MLSKKEGGRINDDGVVWVWFVNRMNEKHQCTPLKEYITFITFVESNNDHHYSMVAPESVSSVPPTAIDILAWSGWPPSR